MRIVSLVPHATELLFALGLGEHIVGVTHECDHPEQTGAIAHVTRDLLPAGLSAAEIDAAVREATAGGGAIYALDEQLLKELEPTLIVTQRLCPVCAVSFTDVERIAARLNPRPQVVALDPKTLGETMGDIRTVAQATGAKAPALDLVARLRSRIDAVKHAVRGQPRRNVIAIEWLDPPFIAGHWTPQLIDLAGGVDLLGFAGEPSEQLGWDAIAAARPEIVLSIPCGFDAEGALAQARAYESELRALGAREIICLDASAYFSRPGPRLVDGLETLAHALHPAAAPSGPGRVLRL